MVKIGLSLGIIVFAVGCESGDSNKSWSEFSLCVAGKGISDPAQVSARIRSVELTERQPPELWDAKKGWPGRCEPYANALYSSLGSSTEQKLLKRQLKAQLGCKDAEPPGCAFQPDGPVLPAAAKLWEMAANAQLKQDPGVQVPLPKHDVKLQTADSWKPLAAEGSKVADTLITPGGTLRFLLKSATGALTVCDSTQGGVSCKAVSSEVPKLASQSVKLLHDEEPIVTGLTEEGRLAFSAKDGHPVKFRGTIDQAARDGLVIEDGEDGSGFLAVAMSQGKIKGKAAFEPHLAEKVQPVGVDNFASWTEGKDKAMQWRFGSVTGSKLKDSASFSGDFAGYLHPCTTDKGSSVGIWGRASGERDAKPTSGHDTAIHVSFLKDGGWSKPVNSTMPFRRSLTASRCAPGRLDVYWAGAEGQKLSVGEVQCTSPGCKAVTSTWPGFGVKHWIAAGAVGNKYVALFTTDMGETRLRVGDPADFAKAQETVLYEASERGGPVFRDVKSFFTKDGVFLLLDHKGPTLLKLDTSGLSPVSG